MSLIKTKSVSFNIENLEQRDLLEWASVQRNMGFSEYVKLLIAKDMKLRKMTTSQPSPAQKKTLTTEGALNPST